MDPPVPETLHCPLQGRQTSQHLEDDHWRLSGSPLTSCSPEASSSRGDFFGGTFGSCSQGESQPWGECEGFFHNLPQLGRPEGRPGQQGDKVGDLPDGAGGHVGEDAGTGVGFFCFGGRVQSSPCHLTIITSDQSDCAEPGSVNQPPLLV